MYKPEHETNIGALIPILFLGGSLLQLEYYIPPPKKKQLFYLFRLLHYFLHRIPLLFLRVPPLFLSCGGLLVIGLRVETRGLRVGSRRLTHRPLSSSFLGLYFESYKVIPKRNCLGAYG